MFGQRHLQAPALVVIALFTCVFLVAAASSVAAPPTDDRLDALLVKAEQQVAAGHVTGPATDNALDTWFQVLAMNLLNTPSAQTAIQSFAVDMRSRSETELTAGRASKSVDYSLFAHMAEDYLKHRTNEPSGAEPDSALAVPASGNPGETKVRPAPPPPASLPAASLPAASPAVKEASIPQPDPHTPAAHAVVAAGAPEAGASIAGAPGSVHQDQAAAALYSERGDAMMAVKDISAARKLYEFAAEAGSARAATALAATYDPAGLRRLGAIGLRPNPGLAELWYRRAEALGDPGAEARLNNLAHETPN